MTPSEHTPPTPLRGLPPLPARLATGSALPSGRWAGPLREDITDLGPRRGRLRRWCYVAAGGDHASVGAAVVDIGLLAVTFAWVLVGARTLGFDRRLPLGRHAWVAPIPAGGAGAGGRGWQISLGGDGALELDVPTPGGRLRASVTTREDVTPVVLCTRTPEGGWNVTQKAAGTRAAGWLRLGDGPRTELGSDASGWRDWTTGRQDRTTTWRWAAGGGTATDGRRVGLNVSTGMNGREVGEDVVWWEGEPHALDLAHLRPVDEVEPTGAWDLGGPGWALHLDPSGLRREDVQLGLLTSRYVQPIGRLHGTLPDPTGTPQPVALAGVTEDHLARW